MVVPVSQRELADAVGTVREVVVRVLRELRCDGVLRTERDQIVILDPTRLVPVPGWNHYVNFLMDEGEERIRQAYGPAKYDRLKALKRTYDPDNFFRLNQNIPHA
jgi:hypothetical protein